MPQEISSNLLGLLYRFEKTHARNTDFVGLLGWVFHVSAYLLLECKYDSTKIWPSLLYNIATWNNLALLKDG